MKIFVAGTFDNFHVGHQYLLWSAYNQIHNLIVVVSRDKTTKKIKGKLPRNTEVKRFNRIKKEFDGFTGVDVQLGRGDRNFLKTLEKYNPTHIFLGYDQKADIKKINQLFPKIKIERMDPYFSNYFKSSKF